MGNQNSGRHRHRERSVAVRVPASVHAAALATAKDRGVPIGDVVAEALVAYRGVYVPPDGCVVIGAEEYARLTLERGQ